MITLERTPDLNAAPHTVRAELSRFMHMDDIAPTVTWSVGFRGEYKPLGWLLYQAMVKRMMGKVRDGNLQGPAAEVERGQPHWSIAEEHPTTHPPQFPASPRAADGFKPFFDASGLPPAEI